MRTWLGLCLVLFLSSGVIGAAEPEFIPLQKGDFWIYEGDVSWVEADANGQNQIYKKHLTWRSEVTAVEKKDGNTVALVHGSPFDLTWYNSKKQPSDRLLLLIGTDYYEVTQHALETFQKLKAAKGDWAQCYKEINAAEVLLPTPLAEGKCFGDSPGNYISRRYCYVVGASVPFDLSTVKDAPKLENSICYSIDYRSSPEMSQLCVVPGLGIVNYFYSHHGTTSEVDVHLVQFGHSPQGSPSR